MLDTLINSPYTVFKYVTDGNILYSNEPSIEMVFTDYFIEIDDLSFEHYVESTVRAFIGTAGAIIAGFTLVPIAMVGEYVVAAYEHPVYILAQTIKGLAIPILAASLIGLAPATGAILGMTAVILGLAGKHYVERKGDGDLFILINFIAIPLFATATFGSPGGALNMLKLLVVNGAITFVVETIELTGKCALLWIECCINYLEEDFEY